MARSNRGNPDFSGALQRRFSRGTPGMGTPGPRGGAQQLSPSNAKSAGSMVKSGSTHPGLANPGSMVRAPKPGTPVKASSRRKLTPGIKGIGG